MTNITPRSTRKPTQGLENVSDNQIASLFQDAGQFGHVVGNPNNKNV